MQYLFQKTKGSRKHGETPTAELYHGWVQSCVQMGRSPGKLVSFQHEMWVLRGQGIVEISRTEPGEKTIPKNFYILTKEYFEYMRGVHAKM